MKPITKTLIESLGPDIIKTGDNVPEHVHSKDFSRRGDKPFLVALPRTTEQVSQILKICNDAGQPVVPQGGMSGLAGGAVPKEDEVVISLNRMNAIEEIDLEASVMTVQAGAVLQTIQEAADDNGMLFPLDLGGRGSCQAGGFAATNAGGNRVLRFGMARALILGVEAVLPNGTVINSLNKMLKNNAGYDLKQLFIGSEGTLGIITRLNLRLFPKSTSVSTAFCAATSYDDVLKLLKRANAGLAGTLSAFEVMWEDFYEVALKGRSAPPPIAGQYPIYVLMEALGASPELDSQRFEQVLGEALEAEEIADAAIAQSMASADAMWDIRDAPGEFRQTFWPNTAFDVSLPIGSISDFVTTCKHKLSDRWNELESVFFGHIADSNIHIVTRIDQKPFPKREIEDIVYETVRDFGGSVSAEHGIGTVKFDFLAYSRTPSEIELMKRLKSAIDPIGILNPGKIF